MRIFPSEVSRTRLQAPRLSSRPIEAALKLLPVGTGTRLVWNFALWLPDGSDVVDVTIDAATGELWTRFSWVADARYRVYGLPLESPQQATPLHEHFLAGGWSPTQVLQRLWLLNLLFAVIGITLALV